MQKNWNTFITAYAEILEAGYKLATDLHHGGVKGEVREYFIEMFLKKIIPDSVGIGSGQIIDQDGASSKQVDLIIYDKKFPILKFSEKNSLFPIESVIAMIEIKSNLNKEELTNALNNCKSVTDLKPTVEETPVTRKQLEDGDTAVEWAYPATYIFAYKGYSSNAQALKQVVEKWHKEELKKQNRKNDANKRSLGLLSFPRMTVTEGCIGLRTSKTLPIKPSQETQLAFGAKKTNRNTHIFVCDLLKTISQRSAFFHPNIPGAKYGMEAYFDTISMVKSIGEEGWSFIERFPITKK